MRRITLKCVVITTYGFMAGATCHSTVASIHLLRLVGGTDSKGEKREHYRRTRQKNRRRTTGR